MSSPDNRPAPDHRISVSDQRRLERARRTVAAMSISERIAMLHQHSPGIARLGIAPFVTGTEALHGVAWKGRAAHFPQPAGMAASWDPDLLRAAAGVVAAEAREMHADDPRASLSVWAPVVNPLRHPFWGRNEEGYSEDPTLNAALACGFAGGLRGGGETWTVLPTLKHFLAYSSETDRAATSSELSPRVLHEYELPGYLEPLTQERAASVMLSYNLVNGRAAHVSDLLESQLRSELADPDLLFVVSDAGAPGNLFRSQKVTPDAPTAYAAMLRAGVDSFTDNDTDPTETVAAITHALEDGLITLEHVDRAVVRQLVARARTGEFETLSNGAARNIDNSSASIPGHLPSDPAHPQRAERRALSREVATRSAVLLSHAGRATLPLRPGSLAVIGEQAHTVLRDWYSGELHDPVSLAGALRSRATDPETVRTARALDRLSLDVIGTGSVPGAPGGETDPEPVLLATDSSLRLLRRGADGPRSALPGAASFEVVDLGEDLIALRETSTSRLVTVDERGQVTATAERVGGWVAQETFRRLTAIDGTWQLQHVGSGRFLGLEHHSGALILRGVQPTEGARFAPRLQETAADSFAAATEGARAVVLVLGNDPHVHGRETEDRPHVRLSGPDRAAAELLAALPDDIATVLVITSSYPYDLEGLEERVGAVVWSSHAGEAEGEALADLLTGRRDFSGRLAQTWPDSAPLPSVLDYDVISTGSTYLYGQGARFSFGHGLTLDRAGFSDVQITPGEESVQVSVTLTPPAERITDGPLHEVVQVYAEVPASSFPRRLYTVPVTRLIGFDTPRLDPASPVTTSLEIPYRRLALFAPDREAWELPEGPLTVRVARSSRETVTARKISIPRTHLARHPLPTPSGQIVSADRAEQTSGLTRSATTLLEGTELRPTGTSAGIADLVLEEGTVVTELLTRDLDDGALTSDPGRAELVAPTVPDPSAAPALPLPHRVDPAGGRPTGPVRVRITGPLALTGLRVQRP